MSKITVSVAILLLASSVALAGDDYCSSVSANISYEYSDDPFVVVDVTTSTSPSAEAEARGADETYVLIRWKLRYTWQGEKDSYPMTTCLKTRYGTYTHTCAKQLALHSMPEEISDVRVTVESVKCVGMYPSTSCICTDPE